MRVLITNVQLNHRTGTEIVVRDLSSGLMRRGHDVVVYTPNPGIIAEEMSAAGSHVVSDLSDVPFIPDVIHGHHHTPTVEAAATFPGTPALFVCHDRYQYEDIAPRIGSVRRHVAVDRNCLERLVHEAQIPPERIALIHNAVDLRRFPLPPEAAPPRTTRWGRVRQAGNAPVPSRPRRAALFSNNTEGAPFADAVIEACARIGLPLDIIGVGAGTSTATPELQLVGYDVVFAKARCALEALCCGCAVVLIDRPGMGPLVTRDNVDALRDWNFGMRCLQGTPEVGRLIEAIDGIDPVDVRATALHVREVADLERALERYESLYRTIVEEGVPATRHAPVAREGLSGALIYAASLEGLLRSGGRPTVMAPLPEVVAEHLSLEVHAAPQRLVPGSVARIQVTLSNHSRETLASTGPNPVHLSYRWTAADPSHAERLARSVPVEPRRTALVRPVAPHEQVTQDIEVDVPPVDGSHVLGVTLVQEGVQWFDQVRPPLCHRMPVLVCEVPDDGPHDGAFRLGIEAVRVGSTVLRDGVFSRTGFIDDTWDEMLTFVDHRRFIDRAVRHGGIACIVTSPDLAPELASSLPEVGILIADDPKRTFFRIHNGIAAAAQAPGRRRPSEIDPSARIHPTAWVDPCDVTVLAGASVGPHAVVHGPCRIGEGVTIDAGTVIGATAFQASAKSGDYLDLSHAGGVTIGASTHVYANAVIARGVFHVDTVIGERCSIGNGVFVSHQCRLSDHVFVGHGATLNGRVVVGAQTWIGPGSTISNSVDIGAQVHIALGSTVVQDLPDGAKVSGLTALDHHTMLRHTVELKRGRRRP